VLDGLRRARNNRRSELRLSPNARKIDQYYEQESQANLASEFPNGGARPKSGDPDEEVADTPVPQQKIEEPAPETTITKPATPSKPVQASLELDDPVPMLMETVDDDEQVAAEDSETPAVENDEIEPSLGNLEELDTVDTNYEREEAFEPSKEENSSLFQRARSAVEEHLQSQLSDEVVEKKEQTKPDEIKATGPEEILIVNIMARSDVPISGAALKEAFSTQKLKFGEMGIFHRHHKNDGDAGVVFSVANIVEPGSFDFANMETIETPGICLFLSLPTVCSAVEAYNDLVSTARSIAAHVGGDLKDENRSTFTNQTVEHGKQRAMEFERKLKLSASK